MHALWSDGQGRLRVQDLAKEYSISAMPTFIVFNKGEKAGSCVGADLGKMQALMKQCAPLTTCVNLVAHVRACGCMRRPRCRASTRLVKLRDQFPSHMGQLTLRTCRSQLRSVYACAE